PAPTPPADPAPAAGGALLTQAALDSMVDAAIERWAEAGATAGQLAAMRATAFSVSDMSGLFLGTSSSGTVRIDSDAAGRGWFIDSTPGEDGEFGGSGSRLTADAGGDAAGRMDLLTVVMHELGHQIGLVDDYNANQSDELMYGYANLGERRLAQADDLVGADLGHAGHEAFVLSPPVIPLLPQNKSVKIEFTSTVNDLNNGIFNNTYTNSSTVTGSNFTTAVANEDLVVDSLTLGDRVYVDANNNNTFDAGEGVSGVALTLFADDGDTAGVLDDNDTELTTGATGADGLYSFVNLSPGDFIVRVDAENFAAGTGALDGRITGNGAADPDTVSATMDGDDNGILQVDGSVASQAITLDYDTEPTSDGGIVPKNDVNNTLDFGFLLPNQAPVITSPATASGDEDTRIAVTGVSIADADAGTDALIVTLTVAAGALDITTATGLTVDSSVAGTLVLTGNLTDLNNGLATLGYTPVADYNGGPVTLTINANDQGNNGPDPGVGDPNSEEDETTVAITVNAVADIDNDTFNLTEDAGATTLTVLANDSFEGSGRAITDVGTALHGTVVIDDNDTIGNLTDDFIVYTPDADYNGSDSFTYEVTSGGVTETATVTVNLAPAVDVVTDAVNVDEDSSANLLDLLGNDTFADSGASITDASDPTNGSVTIDDKGTLDTTDDVVLYTPDAGYVGADSFTYEVTAGGVTETGTVNVTVGPINDAPTSTNLSGDSVTWNEGDSTTLLDFGSDATLDDVDSSDFQGGTLTVSIGTGKVAGEDQLSLTNSGTVTVASGVVSVGGNPVGNVSGGGAGGGNLVIAFNTAFATPTAVAAVISAVAYSNSGGDNPTDGDRTINWTIVDGDGNAGAAEDTLSVSSLVDVDPSNDAPFFQGSDTGPGSTLAYTENDPASALAPTAVLTDADSPDFGGGSLKVSLQANGESADELGILAVGGITLSGSDVLYNLTDIGDWSGGGAGGGDLQIDLDSDATVAAVDALIQAISYRNVSNNPGTLPRTVNFEVKDGDGGTSQANATVNFTAADDPASPVNDSATTKESDTVNIDVVFNDTDVDGPTPLAVTKIGTEDIATGETVTLTSGAKVTLNADGTLTYDPFGQFNDLAKFGSGASNTTDSDSFSYTLGNGGTGTVNVTIEGEYSVIHLLLGTNGADTINGTLGQDVFQPGTGADSMTGFSDDDVYTVDNVGDQPIEAFGQGTDTVLTSLANYSLHKHIENLVLLTGAVNGIGNQLENGIIGNDEANLLNGLGGADAMAGEGGDDTYIVQNSGDEVIETSALDGTDTVYSSAGAFTLGDFVENLHLVGAGLKGTGNGLDNLITGSSRGNTIDGKAGADTMAGNQGDDTYIVDNVGDQVIELGDGGTDTVKSSVSFRLGDGVNHLELTGTAANGTGNNLANIITGNGSANILKGANGNDKLLGGGDNDSLYGGAGNDVLRGDGGADGFYFDASINTPNVDSIVDFTVADDTIFLSKSYFKGIATGTLSAAAFHTGAAAADSSDRIVYDSATGNLFYDSDGTGADAQVLFATLDTGLALTNADFVLFI
ncbi:MAG TPA: Ig-like domain-containing protein, partial [Allosphingosinicella sp.]|nr:Ig-like domain-containing protein [Allosphingosinicella sp.]